MSAPYRAWSQPYLGPGRRVARAELLSGLWLGYTFRRRLPLAVDGEGGVALAPWHQRAWRWLRSRAWWQPLWALVLLAVAFCVMPETW